MLDVFNLVLPFFGLIFLGFFVARINRQPLEALGWMNTFIVYVALPALFFQILSKTPVAELTQWAFIIGCTMSTFGIFLAMFLIAYVRTRKIDESTIQGLAAAYGNIGYMGPAPAILAFGTPAAVPVALIFCFDNTLHFVMAPLMMALSGNDKRSSRDLAIGVVRKIFGHPFIIATFWGGSSNYRFAATSCHRTNDRPAGQGCCSVCAFCHGRDAGFAPHQACPEGALSGRSAKAAYSALADLRRAERCWQLSASLDFDSNAYGGFTHCNQCLRHCPAVWRMGRTGLQQRAGDDHPIELNQG